MRGADIVFRGTVVALHNPDGRTPTAVFKVSRVWKGKVTESFEMTAYKEGHGCIGFTRPMEVGAEFLVYAHHLPPGDPEYLPLPCQSELTKYSEAELHELGSGRRPRRN
jgi:hypothetical protein